VEEVREKSDVCVLFCFLPPLSFSARNSLATPNGEHSCFYVEYCIQVESESRDIPEHRVVKQSKHYALHRYHASPAPFMRPL